MAYDEGLAQRIRESIDDRAGVVEKKMFGGICFMLRGHMVCGVVGEELMVRVGPDEYETSLARPHAREMDFTGRALRGMVYVGVKGIEDDADLLDWVNRASDFAMSLPAKSAKPAARKTPNKKPAVGKQAAGKKVSKRPASKQKTASKRKPAAGKSPRKK